MLTISTPGACVVPALANLVMVVVVVATEVAETSAGPSEAPPEATGTIIRDIPTEAAGREWRPGDTSTSTQSVPLPDLFKVRVVFSTLFRQACQVTCRNFELDQNSAELDKSFC